VRRSLVVAAIGLGLFALGVGALVLFVRRDHEARAGEEQIYDDFGFAVVGAERAGGRCTIELQVANHAKRVPFKMDNFRVRLVDARGERYEDISELATHPKPRIEAGETVVEWHVFDLPQEARGVRLEVSFGTIPDALDWVFLGKRTYALP